ncbi:unnamed protein product [Hymenolepis diminuta]|uniref:Uncharacterized protein n=1 Tax=Hymenolepis diminuta TaxID=6216 RepID=A0A564Y6D2_HYMDI|nr:unnamed protein product [Hymenolepis diminuta]
MLVEQRELACVYLFAHTCMVWPLLFAHASHLVSLELIWANQTITRLNHTWNQFVCLPDRFSTSLARFLVVVQYLQSTIYLESRVEALSAEVNMWNNQIKMVSSMLQRTNGESYPFSTFRKSKNYGCTGLQNESYSMVACAI